MKPGSLFVAAIAVATTPSVSSAQNGLASTGYTLWVNAGYVSVGHGAFAPPAFDLSHHEGTTIRNESPYAFISTGPYDSHILSDVDGLPGKRTASAAFSFEDVYIRIGDPSQPVFELLADRIAGSALVTGDSMVLGQYSHWSSDLAFDKVRAWYQGVALSVPTNPELNHQLVYNQDFRATMNSQGPGGVLAIEILAFNLQGGANSQIFFGEATALVGPIPEPGTFVAIAFGFGLLAVRRLRRT